MIYNNTNRTKELAILGDEGILHIMPGYWYLTISPLLRLRQCYPTLPNYFYDNNNNNNNNNNNSSSAK